MFKFTLMTFIIAIITSMSNYIGFTILALLVIGGCPIGFANSFRSPLNQDQVLPCGFTADFKAFLKSKDLSNLDRTDIRCASYGGKKDKMNENSSKKNPVIFIHGNSDVAFG